MFPRRVFSPSPPLHKSCSGSARCQLSSSSKEEIRLAIRAFPPLRPTRPVFPLRFSGGRGLRLWNAYRSPMLLALRRAPPACAPQPAAPLS